MVFMKSHYIRTGKARKVCGFDISEGAIARAISKFNDAAVPSENYCFAVSDANNLTLEGNYDLILSSGALPGVA
jgi:ubiquinone/menaquinone biosynthesis C-methylase UbiE